MSSSHPQPWTPWVLVLIAGGGFGVLKYLTTVALEVTTPWTSRLLFVAAGAAVCAALHVLYGRLWKRSPPWPLVAAVAVAACVVGAVAWSACCLLVIQRHGFSEVLAWLSSDWAAYARLLADQALALMAWSGLYFGWRYGQEIQRQREARLRAETLAGEAKLEMLRYQINPHFLFNALNSVHALIREDPERAESMLEELSDLLRSTLSQRSTALIPLGEEVAIIRCYLAIEQIRFQEKLATEVAVDQAVEEHLVPALLVHPLVDNAVKYGMQTSPRPLRLKVIAEEWRRGGLRITVSHTGHWLPPKAPDRSRSRHGTGIGLDNIRQRLQATFGSGGGLRIFEDKDWIHAQISIAGAAAPGAGSVAGLTGTP